MRQKWLLFTVFVLHALTGWAQNSPQALSPDTLSPKTILVLGFPLSQFYSNVYYVDELASLNDTTTRKVIPLYNQVLTSELEKYSSNRYRFVVADSAEAAPIYQVSTYVDWENQFNEPYVALGADSVLDRRLQMLMARHGADYLLSINYYDLSRGSSPNYVSPNIRTRHIVHYELFNPDLSIASAGAIPLLSNDLRATSMRNNYRNLAEEILLRLGIYAGNYPPEVAERKYFLLRERLIRNSWGTGLFLGWNSAYGWLGGELTRYLGNQWDINAGIGVGPSGFKAGIGIRYFLLNQGKSYKPFLGINYAWASGMQMKMGGTEDDDGNQINPGDVTTFRIPSAQSVHVKTGFRWLFTNRALLLGVGYGIPFGGRKEAIIKDPGENVSFDVLVDRRRTANLFTVGGVDISLTYIYYFGHK